MDNKSRTIIRLIDVALIILLGFIAISRLKTEHIDLPSGSNPSKEQKKYHEMSLRIHDNTYEVVDGRRKKKYSTLGDLEAALAGFGEKYNKTEKMLILNIESHKTVIVQSLVEVIDICQRHKIQKNLNYVAFK